MTRKLPDSEKAVGSVAEQLSAFELVRLHQIKKDGGDFSGSIGETVVNHLLILGDSDLCKIGEQVIYGIRGDLEKIASDPVESQKLLKGVLKELETRHFFVQGD